MRPLTQAALIGAFSVVLLSWPWQISAQTGRWERDGLEGRDVRALAIAPDSGVVFATTGGSREPTPLWFRESQGWTQASRGMPGFVLTIAPLLEGGILLGAGRDISDQPGVFWVGGKPLASRRLYDNQAIGALAVAARRGGSEVYAATAPWADRDAGSELLRRDPSTGAWSTLLRGSLVCGPTPSYFKQVALAPAQPATLYALEWCFTSMVHESQLWRSDDRGQTWSLVPRQGAASWLLNAFAVDPSDPNVVYVAGLAQEGASAPGVERTLDGGQTWTVASEAEGLARVRVLQAHPRQTWRVLAGTERNGVFASEDWGDTWQVMPGLEGLRIWGLTIDEAEDRLYAATSDGVWRTTLGAGPSPAS